MGNFSDRKLTAAPKIEMEDNRHGRECETEDKRNGRQIDMED